MGRGQRSQVTSCPWSPSQSVSELPSSWPGLSGFAAASGCGLSLTYPASLGPGQQRAGLSKSVKLKAELEKREGKGELLCGPGKGHVGSHSKLGQSQHHSRPSKSPHEPCN